MLYNNITVRKTWLEPNVHSTSYCDNFGENWRVSKAPWLIFWACRLSLLSWGKVSWDRKAGHHGFSIQLLILVYEECLKYCWNLFHYTKKAQRFQPFSELPQSFVNNKLLSNDMFIGNLTNTQQRYISDWHARGKGYNFCWQPYWSTFHLQPHKLLHLCNLVYVILSATVSKLQYR